ncbi:MAG TPA: EAL domain-containing protein [Chthonomonadaceae bacterium]|nr:EAL domain-containing protein [Chthonomonadaceae bacterium]
MTAFQPLRLLNVAEEAPIPTRFAEPLERLLAAFRPGSLLLLLSVGSEIPEKWLTAARIETHLYTLLLESPRCTIWPLLESVWAIALSVPGEATDPINTLHLQALRHTLAERLEADWQVEHPSSHKDTSAGSEAPSPAGYPRFTLTPIAPLPDTEDMKENISELNSLLEIIVQKQLQPLFQPIVNLSDGQVIGYEALIRGPKPGTLRRGGAMFRAADKARVVSWYDSACQEQCFAVAAAQRVQKLLFINIEAEGLSFLEMHERSLACRARDHGLMPADIVIEITERQAVKDFPRLLKDIQHLRDEGFKIAVDDAGSGYSSLSLIAELRPEFIKVDRGLVRNLDVCGERRALLAALVEYARNIGSALLAEGAETYEELSTLIDIGVTYGQGYLMGKPADTFRGISRSSREFIQQRVHLRTALREGESLCVGALARKGWTLPPDASLGIAAQKFARDLSLTSVVVVEDNSVCGLIMREQLETALEYAKAADIADMLPMATVSQWMRTTLLYADERASLAEIARQVTTRSDVSLETDIVVVSGVKHYVGVLPVRILMETVLRENSSKNPGRQEPRNL